MTKAAAIHSFWSSFGMNAYEENSVPTNAKLPYITYELITDSFGKSIPLSASIWDKSSSWTNVNNKAEDVAAALTGGKTITCDGGAILLHKGSPFANRMGDDEDKQIRRVLININADFITII